MSTPKRTRQKHDWTALHEEWKASSMTRVKFLEYKGLNLQSGNVHKNTKHWESPLALAAAPKTAKRRRKVEVFIPEVTGKDVGRAADGVLPKSHPSAWQMLQTWRKKQSKEDYEAADRARTVVKLLLRDSVTVRKNAEGNDVFSTSLKPHEVRQLTQALSDVQRIQRLALGLSTENHGVDSPAPADETHVEKNVTPEESIPTFRCIMSASGRFFTPRPRRVS